MLAQPHHTMSSEQVHEMNMGIHNQQQQQIQGQHQPAFYGVSAPSPAMPQPSAISSSFDMSMLAASLPSMPAPQQMGGYPSQRIPQPMPIYAQVPPQQSASGQRACRFAWNCTRLNCYFMHPSGRQIDNRNVTSAAAVPTPTPVPALVPAIALAPSTVQAPPGVVADRTNEWFAIAQNCPCCRGYVYGCRNNVKCVDLSQCVCVSNELEQGQPHQDTWIPTSRNCTCCKGFIYNCESPVCDSLGTCGCVYENA